MATNNPTAYPFYGTITATSFAVTPDVNSTVGGYVAISHDSTSRALIVSWDGTNDCVRIPPNMSWNAPSEVSSIPGQIWFKLDSAGTTNVTVSIISRAAGK